MIIRGIVPEDAPAYRELCLALDGETSFRLYEPGERSHDLEGFREEIERFCASSQSNIFVAEDAETNQLMGYLQAIGRPQRRISHVVSINIGVLLAYTGQGIGKRLFSALEEWAMGQGIHRLDLTVMETNPGALRLYERLGFEREGIKRCSMQVDGAWIDEIYMSKWLEKE